MPSSHKEIFEMPGQMRSRLELALRGHQIEWIDSTENSSSRPESRRNVTVSFVSTPESLAAKFSAVAPRG